MKRHRSQHTKIPKKTRVHTKYYDCPKYFHTLQQPRKENKNPAVALSLTSNGSSPRVHTQNAILPFSIEEKKEVD